MRTLLLLGLCVGGAFMAGWFTIEREGDRTRIEINKTEIRSDARQAIDKGRDLLDKREQERLAREQQQNYGQPQGAWPPQGAPGKNPVQGAGYNTPYANQGYPQQPAPNGYQQPAYNQGYPAPGYNPNAPAGGQQPRYSEMPPPWQQQTR